MRPLIYIMTPVLMLAILFASRFVTWDSVKGENPHARQYLNEGTRFLRAWKMSEAIAAFTRAINIDARYAEAYVKRGLAYYRSGQYEAAIADYNRTLTLKRYHADAYASRAHAYRALGNRQRAIVDYTASLKKRWNAQVLLQQAETYRELGNLHNALTAYNDVIERHPSATAYYLRSKAYTHNRQVEKTLKLALVDLEKALSLEPRFAHAYIRRAYIYQKLGDKPFATSDYSKAIETLTQQIQARQGTPGPLIWRAFAYQKLGEIDNARTDVRAANKKIFRFFLEKY